MAQISEINVDGKRYFLPPIDNQHYKEAATLKTPSSGDWYIYFNIWDFGIEKDGKLKDKGSWLPQKFYSNYLNNTEALTLKPKERFSRANIILSECNNQLRLNINPKTAKAIAPFSNKTLANAIEDASDNSPVPTVTEAIQIFVKLKSGLSGKGEQKENKENTAVTYKSFFKQLLRYCEDEEIENTKLYKIERHQMYKFMEGFWELEQWGAVTYNNNLGYLKSFFNHFAKIYDYPNVTHNLSDKEVSEDSSRFEPFSEEQIKEVFKFLDEPHQIIYPHYVRTEPADKFMALLCRTIFYTFLRPSEIRRLKIKHVKRYVEGYFDLSTDITKNKKKVFNELYLEPSLVEHFKTLGWEKYFNDKKFENFYVFTKDMVPSETKSGRYDYSKSFATVIEKLSHNVEVVEDFEMKRGRRVHKTIKKDWDNDYYSLYSIKHTGNIIAFKAGFSMTQLQLQNRHSSVQQTENYLRNLKQEINAGERPIRPVY